MLTNYTLVLYTIIYNNPELLDYYSLSLGDVSLFGISISIENIITVLSLVGFGILITISSIYKFSSRKIIEKIATTTVGGLGAIYGSRAVDGIVDRVSNGGSKNQPDNQSNNQPNNNPNNQSNNQPKK